MEKTTINNNSNSTETTLSKLLSHHSLSFRKLADAVGVTHPYLNRLARGENKNPGVDIASKIADFFKISIPQLLGKEEIDFNGRPKDLGKLSSFDYNKPEDKQTSRPGI